ncbi:hypothetical protein MPTA5024_32445 [Microbispora sp. ATCC PTA-5024]|nr:hypothetical protein MPTA5024_32445 [Microbispora sp. ATCC PTA-5024]
MSGTNARTRTQPPVRGRPLGEYVAVETDVVPPALVQRSLPRSPWPVRRYQPWSSPSPVVSPARARSGPPGSTTVDMRAAFEHEAGVNFTASAAT